jgi:replication factor C subunit 3/5
MLETAAVANPGSIPGTATIPLMDWERYCALLAVDILREQSPKALLAARNRIYELLVNCIPADVIMKKLVGYLVSDPLSGTSAAVAVIGSAAISAVTSGGAVPPAVNSLLSTLKPLTEDQKFEIVHWGAHYEHRLQLGSRELFHLEAFVAKAMSVIRLMGGPGGAPMGGAGAGGMR